MTDQPSAHVPSPPKKTPLFSFKAIMLTSGLVLLNIVIYFYQLHFASPLDSRENNLLLFGANVYQLSLTGDWWRYPISMLLHSNGVHLAFNSLALFVIGIECERNYGKSKLLAIYFISGIGAALFSAYWQYYEDINDPTLTDNMVYITVGVGASGAIMGLAAASVIYLYQAIRVPNINPTIHAQQKRLLYNILGMIVLTLISGLQAGVDNAAHIGGASIGALISLGYIFIPVKTRQQKLITGLFVTIAAIGLLLFAIDHFSFSLDSKLLDEREFIYQEINNEMMELRK
ncbi:rhomboid family intramembrane serine protease [Providencia sneebia]|uniref:Peptidase S54 rhomboid domain-containing protein n=1 Tax=Providencia sneebia DSM 19967 TaxID=1141660 RepID=K8WLH5_9GAMM|nr:hypothetical protein OO7_06384 [Providencia sneebia DSM 19967]